MSKSRIFQLLPRVYANASRPALLRTACASGIALTLALGGLHAAGCGASVSGNDHGGSTASDPWLGTASAELTQSAFEVELDAETTSPESPGQRRFIRMAGTWTLTEAPSVGPARKVAARLKVTRLELSDDHALPVGKDKYLRRIRAELERPVVLELDARSAVAGMHAPRDLVSTASGVIRMLAANFQLTTAPAAADRTWTAHERDAAGTYSAEYRMLGAQTISRRKLAYTELSVQGTDDPAPKYELKSAESRFERSPSGAITSCTGSEVVTLDDGEGALPRLETHSKFRFTRKADTGRDKLPDQTAELLALPSRPLSAAPDPEGQVYELDLAKAAHGTSLDTILGDMARTDPERDSGDPHAFRRLIAALEAAIRIDDDAEQAAFARSETGAPYAAEVLGALARSNRPETLLRLAKRLQASGGLSLELRARTLIALSTNPYATEPVVSAIEALSSDPGIGNGAVLGLGALAYRLQRTNPSLSQRIYQKLAAGLDRASTLAETELALRALGNAGNPATLPKLERFLGSPDAKLRALAVSALRRLDDPAVPALLAKIEQDDQDEAVQDAVHRVLSARSDPPPTTGAPL